MSVVILMLHRHDNAQKIGKPYLGGNQADEAFRQSKGKYVSEAATWQHQRQGLPAVPDPDRIIIFVSFHPIMNLLHLQAMTITIVMICNPSMVPFRQQIQRRYS